MILLGCALFLVLIFFAFGYVCDCLLYLFIIGLYFVSTVAATEFSNIFTIVVTFCMKVVMILSVGCAKCFVLY